MTNRWFLELKRASIGDSRAFFGIFWNHFKFEEKIKAFEG